MQRFLKYFVIAILASISLYLFNAIYEASSEVIDELFHLGQGFEYCMGNFTTVSWRAICLHFSGLLCIDFQWDPKITTFPGLYLLATFIPEEYCDIYALRLIPFTCSIINAFLIHEIRSLILFSNGKPNDYDVLLETVTIATLPPMYFFSFVYYTDVPSITMILFMLLFSLKQHHKLSALFGAFSVLMRQTNILWVAGTLGVHLVDKMMLKVYPKMKRENATFGNFLFALKSHLKHPKILMEFMFGSIWDFFGYILVIVSFMVFLYINGSIVGE